MKNLELPKEFKNIYPITIYEDEIGTFYKCIKGTNKIVFIEKIGDKYKLVEDKQKLNYLKKKYNIPLSWIGEVF